MVTFLICQPGDDAKKSKPSKATSNKPASSAGEDTKKQASTSPKQSPTPTSGAAVEENNHNLKIGLAQKNPKAVAPVLPDDVQSRRKRDTNTEENNDEVETEVLKINIILCNCCSSVVFVILIYSGTLLFDL